MVNDDEGFLYPLIDDSLCVNCGLCIKVCQAVNPVTRGVIINAYAYKHNNDVRKMSSSGGAFTALSDIILIQGGIVVGAGYDEEFFVVHKFAASMAERDELRGSKYVQSNLNGCFKRIESILKQGKPVLFVGTPCQVGGLKNYLSFDYSNLITCDLICHGVPSPSVYSDFIDYIKIRIPSKIKSIQFRDKEVAWKGCPMKLCLSNGKVIAKHQCYAHTLDFFLKVSFYDLFVISVLMQTQRG